MGNSASRALLLADPESYFPWQRRFDGEMVLQHLRSADDAREELEEELAVPMTSPQHYDLRRWATDQLVHELRYHRKEARWWIGCLIASHLPQTWR